MAQWMIKDKLLVYDKLSIAGLLKKDQKIYSIYYICLYYSLKHEQQEKSQGQIIIIQYVNTTMTIEMKLFPECIKLG